MFKKFIIVMILLVTIFNTAIADGEERIQGANRYETAAKISKATFDKSKTVIIANGSNYVDALAASTLANIIKSPIILTQKASLPEISQTEILRLGASEAIILGGKNTISEDVEEEISQLGLISKRIGGKDRYETSLLILDEIKENKDISEIYIASNIADAVSSSAYRAGDIALILVNKNNPSPEIEKLNEKKIILGGEASISEELYNKLGAVDRIGGSNRFETAKILAEMNKIKREAVNTVLVNAYEFIDAFTVSTYANSRNMNILLTPGEYLEEYSKQFINENKSKVVLIGGPNSVADGVLVNEKPKPEPEPDPIPEPDPNAIDPSKPMIALTYDDGPQYGATDRLLDTLKANNAKATFFVVGERVASRADLVKRTIDEGHEIGNHSFSHKDLSTIGFAEIQSEISRTQEVIYNTTGGFYPVLVRPPYGSVNQNVKDAVSLPLINWSVDTVDWKTRNPDSVADIILTQAKDGDIVLMHDLYDTSAIASERVIPILKQRGFQLVTVSDLFKYRGINAIPGYIYYYGR